jgi:dipeptidyl aminopeptidase/acylaminoacyl peptidase
MHRLFATCLVLVFASFGGALPAAAQTAPAPAQRPLTAEDFVREPDIADVALSPNGRLVAAFRRDEAGERLVVIDMVDKKLVGSIALPGDIEGDWVEFATDGRVVFGFTLMRIESVNGRYIEYPTASRVMAADVNGARPVILFESARGVRQRAAGYGTFFAGWIDGTREEVMMTALSAKPRLNLYRVNLLTGQARVVEEGTPTTVGWVADKDGRAAMRVDSNTSFSRARLFVRDAAGAWREVRTTSKRDGKGFEPIGATSDPNRIFVYARKDGDDRIGVHVYDLRTAAIVETLFVHPQYDVLGAAIDRKTRAFLGASYIAEGVRYDLRGSGDGAALRGLQSFFGNDYQIEVLDRSDDRKTWLLFAASPQDPGSWYLFNQDRAAVEPVGARNAVIPGRLPQRTRHLSYKARDGLEINGYLTTPSTDKKAWPLIVLPHGGPELRDSFGWDPMAQYFAAFGYAVLQPNYRGSSGYGFAFVRAGRGEWGGKMQDDLTDGVRHLVAQGLADPKRVAIVGASYGGYAALAGATLTPDVYRCAASVVGVTDLPDFLAWNRTRTPGSTDAFDYWVETIGDPETQRDELIAMSPARQAASVRIPIYLAHGVDDEQVPIAQGRKMKRALEAAGKTVTWSEFLSEGHSFSRESEARLYRELATFLRGCNPP